MIHVLGLAATLTAPMVVGQDIEYTVGDKVMQGYVAARTDAEALSPGVMVIHDWNGIDAYEKMRADMLASMGYVAFCVDIYGKGVRPKTTQESAAESGKYYQDNNLLRIRLAAGLRELNNQATVQKGNLAAIGYCFGGMAALEMARGGMGVKGVASFHGSLKAQKPMARGAFKGKIIVFHGNADPFVPQADVDAFKTEMREAGAMMEFVGYPGAVHSFTLKDADKAGMNGVKYDANADSDSWTRLGTFLKSVLGA